MAISSHVASTACIEIPIDPPLVCVIGNPPMPWPPAGKGGVPILGTYAVLGHSLQLSTLPFEQHQCDVSTAEHVTNKVAYSRGRSKVSDAIILLVLFVVKKHHPTN